ncbi:MAG: DUF1697 domain-containing protein [Actinobacteria bacterium]|nr:DUF1697 domain-containing protein [Actinomycetota bacterium]
MTTAVALFIRAVMHGRDGFVPAVLVAALEGTGAGAVRTHLTTGNVTLVTTDVDAVVDVAERSIREMAGDRHEVFVRTRDELDGLLAADPFAGAPPGFGAGGEVTFARSPLPPLDLPITSPRGDHVVFAATRRELFTATRVVDGHTSGPGGRLERLVDQPLTTRGLGTVERVAASLRSLPDRPGGRIGVGD